MLSFSLTPGNTLETLISHLKCMMKMPEHSVAHLYVFFCFPYKSSGMTLG